MYNAAMAFTKAFAAVPDAVGQPPLAGGANGKKKGLNNDKNKKAHLGVHPLVVHLLSYGVIGSHGLYRTSLVW